MFKEFFTMPGLYISLDIKYNMHIIGYHNCLFSLQTCMSLYYKLHKKSVKFSRVTDQIERKKMREVVSTISTFVSIISTLHKYTKRNTIT